MSSTDFIDAYCERTQALAWDEPFNIVSNAAFILVAGLLLWRFAASSQLKCRQHWDTLLLIALIAAIGIGSSLWHIYAQKWAELADLIPINLFISVYLVVFIVRVMQLRPGWGILGLLIYHAANTGMRMWIPADTWNGSIIYLPSFLALILMCLYLMQAGRDLLHFYIGASALFLVGLIFRTLDMALCPYWPIGTHFVWHLVVAAMLYVLVQARVRHAEQQAR